MNLFWASFILYWAICIGARSSIEWANGKLSFVEAFVIDVIGAGLVAYALWLRG